ncbi:hypothetical protein [Marinomonas ostreistagni]|uniref:hypothetical protein n=1 Tax=Marinomonas ostreistagni TaxID=359209 RepID=UPI001EF19CEE|nr:hypothetical protein [Marinomonas ostreistagni]
MALRHAESIIMQNGLTQGDIPMYQLCDRNTLFKVSWNGVPLHAKSAADQRPRSESLSARRFSEKPVDPSKAYASARTILDDLEEAPFAKNAPFEFNVAADHTATSDMASATADAAHFREQNEPACEPQDHDSAHTVEPKACEQEVEDSIPSNKMDEVFEEALTEVHENDQSASVKQDESTPTSKDDTNVNAERFSSYDNVINAANAFRPSGEQFKETLRNQYASSNPDVPFEEDSYWRKVYNLLADFDESDVLSQIDSLEHELSAAEAELSSKRTERAAVEQEEQRERSERARIEQSFEEAIERAFQARARAYEAWEKRRAELRVTSMRAEQEAQQGFQDLEGRLEHCKEQYTQHQQLKEDYRAAKIMHELRRHLTLAAKGDEQATGSYEAVIAIMSDSGLSLRDLEFSDIRNKSLFIRLLERESAQISDVHERELYTEEMLDKFLLASRQTEVPKPSENPVERVQRMLKSIEGVGHFESQKVIEQVLRLMESHQISVRDLDYGCINKYSVFVCLINWEAEQIHSLSEREKFTSSVLEEYVQYSLMNPPSSQKA